MTSNLASWLEPMDVDGTPDEINESILKQNRRDAFLAEHGYEAAAPQWALEAKEEDATAEVDQDETKPEKGTPHQITEWTLALAFIFGGDAYFTIKSLKTGTRFTYHVEKAAEDPRYPNNKNSFFVGVLTGSNNQKDYSYAGMLTEGRFRTTRKSKLSEHSPAVQSFTWLLSKLYLAHMPSNIEFWHEGRCGKCGMKLTVPKSIELGFGPKCRGERQ